MTNRLKTRYLHAVLRQESAWFDIINHQELADRIPKEILAIKRALGEQAGDFTFSITMSISGLAFAFTRGWALTLAILAIAPVAIVVVALFAKALIYSDRKSTEAYQLS